MAVIPPTCRTNVISVPVPADTIRYDSCLVSPTSAAQPPQPCPSPQQIPTPPEDISPSSPLTPTPLKLLRKTSPCFLPRMWPWTTPLPPHQAPRRIQWQSSLLNHPSHLALSRSPARKVISSTQVLSPSKRPSVPELKSTPLCVPKNPTAPLATPSINTPKPSC